LKYEEIQAELGFLNLQAAEQFWLEYPYIQFMPVGEAVGEKVVG
jgi:hypothetical protein